MIAKLEISFCPFLKTYEAISFQTRNEYQDAVTEWAENFAECLEEKCMAWDKKARDCRLCMKGDSNEK